MDQKLPPCSLILFSIVFVILAPCTYAQGNGELIKPLSLFKETLRQELKDKAEKLEKLPHAKKVHYVQLGNLPKLQQKGVFTFTVPDVVRKITAKAIRVEAHSEQHYKWFGTVQGEEIGHVIINC